MITLQEFYTVMSAVVPLYVAMILAYGSVRWWKLLTPAQCSGINRFVAIFAVPLLSFQIIAHNNPYDMNPRFVAADVLQKLIVLAVLASWSRLKKFSSSVRSTSGTKSKDLDWAITLFMVSTLPNTLVLGIPLEVAMYGEKPAELVVQAVVLQCIVWYTLLLFLYEYRSAKNLILEQFPGPSAANISNMFAYTPGRHHYSPSPKTTAHDELQKQVPRSPGPLERLFVGNQVFSPMKLAEAARKMDYQQQQYESREMQMLVWSSSNSPASDRGCYETRKLTSHKNLSIQIPSNSTPLHPCMAKDFSFVDNVLFQREDTTPLSEKNLKSESHLPCKVPFTPPKLVDSDSSAPTQMPPPTVMTKLIVRMMWKKLIRNPNTYASLLGLAWALISFRWNVGMPKILEHSITILSDAGLGMAMFSLGLFMALQSSLIACGTTMAVVVMIIRFVTGPAIMSATSIAVGLRNVQLRASIIQAALPQGIVPFVFAKEYNVHPDVSARRNVIFGMLISLPINLLYYVLLGL
ncbi:auxin efflux carrier component 3-like [Selaginella moellendorffii]|uniref:auxin efflux carrier component 3-like n=1 Tax=Selaginella moellendorffii TaxID=88036 RepID=UPI000D1CB740|nr:auxin efflux carrier component 3-like [Selaginella moellendorffii]|eukprot:XP_024518596.1 auxin efflux carrier component 3-like [Selaginella moellendorffii]